MQPLPLENMQIMWQEDIEAGLRDRSLELIARHTFVRRKVFGDAQTAITRAIVQLGVSYAAEILFYEDTKFTYTWYGACAESRVSYYRRKNVSAEEPILRARTVGDETGLKLNAVGVQMKLK